MMQEKCCVKLMSNILRVRIVGYILNKLLFI